MENLGVEEPSDIAFVEKEIIYNIATYITGSNWLQTTKYLFELHKKGILKEEQYQKLQYLKLLTKDDKYIIPANRCFFSDCYNPRLKLEEFYRKENFYVSEKYLENDSTKIEWRNFFIKIGVSEDLDYKEYKNLWPQDREGFYQEFFSQYPGFEYTGWVTSFRYFHAYTIYKISFIELAENYKFSLIFWKSVLSNLDTGLFRKPFRGHWGDSGNYGYIEGHVQSKSYNEWVIENKAVIPTTLGFCIRAKDTFINDQEITDIAGKFLPVFDYDKPLPEEWRKLLPFKDKLELNDYLTVLEKIAEQTEEDQILRKYNRKRIGLIYNKLASLLPNFSEEKRQEITDWANENKLLSANGKFEIASELKWIKIDGFTTASEKLKIIQLPENCETNSKSFEELISLFQIQIIDKFIPTFEKEKKDYELKNKLQNILPYFVAIIEKKQYAAFTKEFDRLFSIVTKSDIFNATEIKLSFKYQKETIEGASQNVFRELNKFYFKGKWRSPITMFTLIPELSRLLEVTGLNDELRLLLQLDENEIKEWLVEQGLDLSNIQTKPEFAKAVEKVKEYKTEQGIVETPSTNLIQSNDLDKLLKEKNLTIDQLLSFIANLDADEIEDGITFSSNNHLEQKGKNEENRIARELVYERLTSEGFTFKNGIGDNSVVNGVVKDGVEYPLVIKSYRNTSYKFNIRPNEWLQLSKPNAMFWVHRGNGKLEVLKLEGLLRANSDFHVQFETSTFSFEGLVKFAEVFRFVRNVHFQLDAPNFSIAKAFEEYRFDKRDISIAANGKDNSNLLH